ncbi:DUF2333 family protein [Cellvibrio sp. PSBB006]|uniref:DUF2333 family protein n=1 Tax=Cellvibrio sp. PSBB006 TaxID=1987723 RepID=UPI000B3B7AB2|nr:DUF2333 family protein [Cellvibrio sp. PSBB006]ARU29657.1 hypothetical protein CBR65_20660 [Cellvibrio sp. PSBB006]
MALPKFKNLWVRGVRKARDGYSDTQEDIAGSSLWFRVALIVMVIYLLIAVAVGIYWSLSPGLFDVRANAQQELAGEQQTLVNGTVTTATLIRVAETLWDKPGGYLSNDIMPPGLWLDDMPNWEYGVLIQVRDMSKAMREAFSRSQSQSREDKDLILAEPRFNFDNASWIFPASESQYQEGADYLRRYLQRLADDNPQDAQFFARADNLNYWLSTVETRLGNLSQRLSASVGQQRLNTDLPGVAPATHSFDDGVVKTPWNELDDVFFEARGSAWALIHMLKAVEIDFADVLEKKNARVSVQQIIRELEATQQTLFSPIVLNGSGFGMLANHSLVMASYISRANAAIIDLRRLLAQG